MPAIPKPQCEDKPSVAQWNSTLRIARPIKRNRKRSGGGVVCRPKGHRDPRDWASDAVQRMFRERVLTLYGDRCIHPAGDGALCGQAPAEAHHSHFGGRRLAKASQQDPLQGVPLCKQHHNGGDDCPHACATPGQGEVRRRHWEQFATIAMAEGPEAALRWNRQISSGTEVPRGPQG